MRSPLWRALVPSSLSLAGLGWEACDTGHLEGDAAVGADGDAADASCEVQVDGEVSFGASDTLGLALASVSLRLICPFLETPCLMRGPEPSGPVS
ncbi:MAG: hypothetical protein VKO21_10165 [Candidatus Sericytochromatia bacterium]|nr:hypothetical protein [Candidatus Sericytochromatia bacterium]